MTRLIFALSGPILPPGDDLDQRGFAKVPCCLTISLEISAQLKNIRLAQLSGPSVDLQHLAEQAALHLQRHEREAELLYSQILAAASGVH